MCGPQSVAAVDGPGTPHTRHNRSTLCLSAPYLCYYGNPGVTRPPMARLWRAQLCQPSRSSLCFQGNLPVRILFARASTSRVIIVKVNVPLNPFSDPISLRVEYQQKWATRFDYFSGIRPVEIGDGSDISKSRTLISPLALAYSTSQIRSYIWACSFRVKPLVRSTTIHCI